ncbi:hypothetical protein NPIL_34531 [Nephila pilipes]|uniref:Uncharacterized protein n=1 Tax=Nephila pilipes TaxID=299642 RepID=A0A8X6TF20_NEPPI|nr:hypothetical protein NPIL_34531 [Nephila pilipes]
MVRVALRVGHREESLLLESVFGSLTRECHQQFRYRNIGSESAAEICQARNSFDFQVELGLNCWIHRGRFVHASPRDSEKQGVKKGEGDFAAIQ